MTCLPRRKSVQIAGPASLLILVCSLVALVPTALGQSVTLGYRDVPVPDQGIPPARVAVDLSGNAYTADTYHPLPALNNTFLVNKFDPSGAHVLPQPYVLPNGDFTAPGTVATGIAVDPQGNAYVTGYTSVTILPAVAPFVVPAPFNAFVAKISFGNGGTAATIDYFTYLGPAFVYQVDGFQQLQPAIAVDRAGNAYVTGTAGPGFPTTTGPGFGGGNSDAFVVKLNPLGGVVYATYLGGSNDDASASIAVDDAGDAYVTGLTYSSDFPVPNRAVVQPTCPACRAPLFPDVGFATTFVTKLNPSGGLTYSTYLSAPYYGYAIAVDGGGNAYISGRFDRVSKLNADASQLVYSASIPGLKMFDPSSNLSGSVDFSSSIAVNAAGEAWVNGLYEDGFSFFAKLNADGKKWVEGSAEPFPPSPLFTSGEEHDGIAVDASGNAYVIGAAPRAGLPQHTFLLKIDDVNTPVGTNPPAVVVHPMDTTTGLSPVALTFLGSITQAGTTTLATTTVGPTPPSGFQIGNPSTYFELATTAVFTGSVQVCINYAGIAFTTNPPALFHFENGAWTDVTTPPVDTVNEMICGMVTSLSPFAIFQKIPGSLCATDVSSSINITRSGLLPVYGNGKVFLGFAQTLTLKNNSGAAIAGPIDVAFEQLPAGISVSGAGTTSCNAPLGTAFVTVPGSSSLGPGANVAVKVLFTDPSKAGVTYSPRILAGANP